MRHGKKRGRQRIGHLILDHLRRLPRIFGIDDHLRVGEIGQGIERRVDERPDADAGQHERRQQHQQPVARRKSDEARRSWLASGAPAAAWRRGKALQRRAQIALGIDEEIGARSRLSRRLSRPRSPRTQSPPCAPRRTGRGSNRPSPRSMSTTWRAPLSMTAEDGIASTGPVRGRRRDLDARIHGRAQSLIGIGDDDAHARGARLGGERRDR